MSTESHSAHHVQVFKSAETQKKRSLEQDHGYRRQNVQILSKTSVKPFDAGYSKEFEKTSFRAPEFIGDEQEQCMVSTDLFNDDEQTNVTFDYSHENQVPDQDMKPEEAAVQLIQT